MSDFWDDEDFTPRARKRRSNPWFARIGLGIGLVGFVGMVAWGALSLIGDTHTTASLADATSEEDTRFFGLKRECGLHEADLSAAGALSARS